MLEEELQMDIELETALYEGSYIDHSSLFYVY